MNPVLIFTAAGPLVGAVGWFAGIGWLFWVGVVICAITLLLNVASGVMKLPVLPVLFMLMGAFFINPWYVGCGVGLILWTALETVGEIVGIRGSRQ